MARRVGIDLGAQKTIAVSNDGEILRTTTGSIAWPTLVAFHGRSRLSGEEAVPYVNSENTVSMLPTLMGKSLEEVQTHPSSKHRKSIFVSDSEGSLGVTVNYCDQPEEFDLSSILAIFLSGIVSRAHDTLGAETEFSFVMPYKYSAKMAEAVRNACFIAGIEAPRVHLVDASDCIVAAYGRKLGALLPSERAALNVSYFDRMGILRISFIISPFPFIS